MKVILRSLKSSSNIINQVINITKTTKASFSLEQVNQVSQGNQSKLDKSLPNIKKKENFKFDFKDFINNIDYHEMNIKNRKSPVDCKQIINLYNLYTKTSNDLNGLRQKLNQIQKNQKQLSISGEQIPAHLVKDSSKYQKSIGILLKEYEKIEEDLMNEAIYIPNTTSPESPIGDESKNKVLFINKNPYNFDFTPKSHIELSYMHDLIDFPNANKITGSKFCFLKNELVFLEQALINYALYKLRSKGFTILSTPDIVKSSLVKGCGFSPRDVTKNQIYDIKDDDLSLIATSEIPIMGIVSNEILNKNELPLKYAGISHCFRREAGRGEKSKGLYRLHQFSKVEMFIFTEGNLTISEKSHLEILEIQKEIYNDLEIPYRVLEMSTEELGSSAYRKFDIEAFFPSLNDYGEISSCSNCTDFQSRRLLAQYRNGNEKHYVHSLNGTAIAVPRIIMNIMENFQLENGKIMIPKCLLQYMHGINSIGK